MKREVVRKYLSEFVYGATDGTVTTFAIIAGAAGATLSPAIVLILGFANLFADGFSMAASNYLATKSERDLNENEYKKEPLKTALVTFSSFVVIGFVPLFSFVIAPLSSLIGENKFIISIVLTAIAFVVIGYIKGLITKKKPLLAGIESLLIGGAAALLAFFVGSILKGLV